MTQNIKHMREIVEHNIPHEATRIEASVVLDLIEAEMRELRSCIYHTAPGEMEFVPEGWTWRQQARASEDRIKEYERRVDELETKLAGVDWSRKR